MDTAAHRKAPTGAGARSRAAPQESPDAVEHPCLWHNRNWRLIFTGQTLEFPDDFKKNMRHCLDNFVGTRWSKSKKFNPRDPGPIERMKEYERIVQQLDRLAAVGTFNKATVARLKQIVAVRLQVKPSMR